MTYKEFLCELGKAGLSAREFADLTRMNPNSVTNCSARRCVSSNMAIIAALLGEMNEQKVDFRRVFARIDIEPKKPRGAGKSGKFGGKQNRSVVTPAESGSVPGREDHSP
jgi:hypothetical protein